MSGAECGVLAIENAKAPPDLPTSARLQIASVAREALMAIVCSTSTPARSIKLALRHPHVDRKQPPKRAATRSACGFHPGHCRLYCGFGSRSPIPVDPDEVGALTCRYRPLQLAPSGRAGPQVLVVSSQRVYSCASARRAAAFCSEVALTSNCICRGYSAQANISR